MNTSFNDVAADYFSFSISNKLATTKLINS